MNSILPISLSISCMITVKLSCGRHKVPVVPLNKEPAFADLYRSLSIRAVTTLKTAVKTARPARLRPVAPRLRLMDSTVPLSATRVPRRRALA